MSPVRVGILAIVLIALLSYFGFTKANPFSNPYEFKAVFNDVNNLKPRSPVRIAGVDVGKVTKVEPVESGKGGNGAIVPDDNRIPGLAGGTYVTRKLGITNLKDVP